MSTTIATDIYLVNRNGTSYKVTMGTIMSTLADTDLLMVNRGSNSYKITAADFRDSVVYPLAVTLTLSSPNGIIDTALSVSASISGGATPYTNTYQWKSKNPSNVVSNIAGATSSSYTPVVNDTGNTLACEVTVTDNVGNVDTQTTSYTSAVTTGAYDIPRSTRFNPDDTAYLSRTPSSVGNTSTWTWSGWVKRSGIDAEQVVWTAGASTSSGEWSVLRFITSGQLQFINNSSNVNDIDLRTTQVFRDTSAWMHIVLRADISNSTTNDRIDIFINGVKIDAYEIQTQPATTVNTGINGAQIHNIGREAARSTYYCDLYLADVNFVDGTALDATSFGETDATTGQWIPKEFTGTYGTNGFHLAMDPAESNPCGDDSSGNGNDWTAHNLASSISTAGEGKFKAVTYTGNGASTVNGSGGTQSIDVGFQPDFVWIKDRSQNGHNHNLLDTVRGAPNILCSDDTNVEITNSTDGVTALTSTGFTLGDNGDGSQSLEINKSGNTYVAWCWKAGGTSVSNTDGSITSSVSASTSTGFSVASYSTNGTNGATVGHGLNSTPHMIITKSRDDNTRGWAVYHRSVSVSGDYTLALNNTAAKAGPDDLFTGVSSTTFTLGADPWTNWSTTQNMIAYCWSEVSNYSKFSSYTGNGSATGPVVDCGFKPHFVMIKASSRTGPWNMYDTTRSPINPANHLLTADSNSAESTNTNNNITFLSTGFQLGTATAELNESGQTYIYAAFAGVDDPASLDLLVDAPGVPYDNSLNGGGNYATINPIDNPGTTPYGNQGATITNGNLDFAATGSYYAMRRATMEIPSSGKWYMECRVNETAYAPRGSSSQASGFGLCKSNLITDGNAPITDGNTLWLGDSGYGKLFGSTTRTEWKASTVDNGDIISIEVDMDANTFDVKVNNTSVQNGNINTTDPISPFVFSSSTTYTNLSVNFGARSFVYTPPTGYKALNVFNLPEPTIVKPNTVFDTKLYTGNGGTQSITGMDFEPDFVWIKCRASNLNWHSFFDSVRGVQKVLWSNSTNAESDYSSTTYALTSFDSGGFTVSDTTISDYGVNGAPGGTYCGSAEFVSWSWDGGSSTVSNTDGTITSSVRANPSAGFSIVSYTGTGANASVGHSLNKVPDFLIFKIRGSSDGWHVYHKDVGNTKFLRLNEVAAPEARSTVWQDTTPTSSVFSIGTDGGVNNSGSTYISYAWSEVAGVSKFGSFTGNGSADGAVINVGFTPALIMIKRTDGTGTWAIYDDKRNNYNPAETILRAESSDADVSNVAHNLDFLSSGFKLRTTETELNASGGTYIYAAWASAPFKYSNAL